MQITLNKDILYILNMIKNNGYEAYVVGGYIRDCILGIETKDVDITTSATPSQLKLILKEFNIMDNYSNFGNIKFEYKGYTFEITTYRKENNYKNHRKPNEIIYTSSIEEDLQRRDFAMNAICSDGSRVIDNFNGLKDIENRIITMIGDPNVRLEEDALRILRALRFSSKLGFKLSCDIKKSIKENYKYLSFVSYDKKYKELKGILEGKYYLEVIKEYEEMIKEVFLIDKIDMSLFKANIENEVKEAALFYHSSAEINNKFLKHKNIKFTNNKIDIKNKLKKYGKENILNILYFNSEILNVNKDEYKLLNEIIDNNECYNLSMLNIDGNDLLKLNLKEDMIGILLNRLLDLVIEDRLVNDKNILINYAKGVIQNGVLIS